MLLLVSWLSSLSPTVVAVALGAGAVAQPATRFAVPHDFWERLQDDDVAVPTALGAAMVTYWLASAAVFAVTKTRLTQGLFLTGLGIGMAAFVPLLEAAYRDQV